MRAERAAGDVRVQQAATFTLLMGDGGRKRAIHTMVVSNHYPGVLLIGAGCDRRVLGLQFGEIGAVREPRPAYPTVADVYIVSPRAANTCHFAWATRATTDPAAWHRASADFETGAG